MGNLDDVAIWRSILSREAIQDLAAGGSPIGASPGPDFQITEVIHDGQTVTITWPSREGETFVVEQTTDLENFEELTDGHPSGGNETSFRGSPSPIPPPMSSTYGWTLEE